MRGLYAAVTVRAYDEDVRLRGRRRPAGVERVPTEVLTPEVVLEPLGPVVLRLGPGRGLLDYPGGRPCHAIANIWPTDDGWAEACWPHDQRFGWFVAPIDLRLGHILEFRGEMKSVFAWVADCDPFRVVAVVEADRRRAVGAAAEAAAQMTAIAWNALP